MALIEVNAQNLAPGSYVFESTKGRVPADISDFGRGYLLGVGTKGEYHIPTQITSEKDAVDTFGVSGMSQRAIKSIFDEYPLAVVYFVRVAINQIFKVRITTPATGAYEFTLGGVTVTYTATDNTLATGTQGLLDRINSSELSEIIEAIEPDTVAGTFLVRVREPNYPTVSPTVDGATAVLTIEDIAGTSPTVYDFIAAVDYGLDADLNQPGYILAPEAFYSISDQDDRVKLGKAMTAHATEYDWFALIDAGSPATVDTVFKLKAEALRHTAPRGHSSVTIPYFRDLNENWVAASAFKLAVALKRSNREGFREPAAGYDYPLQYTSGLAINISESQHSELNGSNINCIRFLRIQGQEQYVLLGARTRSTDPFFDSEPGRIIGNVLLHSLRNAYRRMNFRSFDGQGELLAQIRATGRGILHRLYQAGALYGQSTAEAYDIIADLENQSSADLERFIVRIKVYYVPTPFVEKLVASVNRVAIGELQFQINQ